MIGEREEREGKLIIKVSNEHYPPNKLFYGKECAKKNVEDLFLPPPCAATLPGQSGWEGGKRPARLSTRKFVGVGTRRA
jgi:hypothetical protein